MAHDIKYLEGFMSEGYAPAPKEVGLIMTIFKLYEQQKYMYDNKVHSVHHRIVSIRQTWICLIVQGKVKTTVEFGAKFDLSLDGEGYARIEKISFESYNESSRTYWVLSNESADRPDLLDTGKQTLLQRTLHPFVRSKAWQVGKNSKRR